MCTPVALAPGVAVAAQGDCAQPVSTGAGPIVTDCLSILRTAVGATTCEPACACAPKGSLPASALDALICLKAAVGQSVTLDCPCEPASTTTTTTTTTTLPLVDKHAFPNACLSVSLRRAFAAPVTLRSSGQVELLIDRSTLGDRDGDGKEDASVLIFFFRFETVSEAFGDVTFELSDPSIHPSIDQATQGVIQEGANDTPGTLEVPPYTESGSALVVVQVYLQAHVDGPNAIGRAHNDFPLILGGVLSSVSPPPLELLTMQNSTDVPLLSDNDHSFFNIWIELSVPATLELNPFSCD